MIQIYNDLVKEKFDNFLLLLYWNNKGFLWRICNPWKKFE